MIRQEAPGRTVELFKGEDPVDLLAVQGCRERIDQVEVQAEPGRPEEAVTAVAELSLPVAADTLSEER